MAGTLKSLIKKGYLTISCPVLKLTASGDISLLVQVFI